MSQRGVIKAMIILHTTDSIHPDAGGPARSVPQLALAQAELGHQVGLWCPNNFCVSLPDLPAEASDRLRILSGTLSSAIKNFAMPSLFHDHGIWSKYHTQVASLSRDANAPLVVSPRGMLEPWALKHKAWKKSLAWKIYQKRHLETVTALHATAETEAQQFRRLGLTKPILTVANGVTLPLTQTILPTPEAETKTALFLGRIHPKKGLPLLIEAWRRVQPEGWKMRVVGPPQDGHDLPLKSQVEAANLTKIWSFEPPLEGPEKWKAMLESDLFILPSHSENFGIVVAEALACGTPVITTTGTPWQELTGRKCGWWVDPTVDALASSLLEATSITSLKREEMGVIGREWMAREFAWPAIAKKTIDYYQSLINK